MIIKKEKGMVVTLVLVFGSIFLIMIGGLLGYILLQLRHTTHRAAWNQALHVAEAGVDYYKWCINNDVEENCEAEKDYYDSEGNLIGSFSVEVDSRTECGDIIERKISSTGWTEKFPDTEREISVSYGRTSVAQFAYLLNDNVWAGSDRTIRGLYHSNGGIKMDGENQSVVSSSLSEWVCTSSFGCGTCPVSDGCYMDQSLCMCPGVLTTTENSNPDLFDFPATLFDFEGITVDLAQIKSSAVSDSVYLPPSTDINQYADGYHIIFNNDGTFDVRIITRLRRIWAYNTEQGWHYDYIRIRDEYFYNTYTLDAECPVLFVEDHLWIEGEITEKITVASANLINPSNDTDVILVDDITYVDQDGTDALALIGERDVLIYPDSPDDMYLNGIFIAQKGHFGINYYPGYIKDYLEILGSVVSNGRVGTRWISGSSTVSGYSVRSNTIDTDLIYSPPCFVPYVDPEFKIVNWEEVE